MGYYTYLGTGEASAPGSPDVSNGELQAEWDAHCAEHPGADDTFPFSITAGDLLVDEDHSGHDKYYDFVEQLGWLAGRMLAAGFPLQGEVSFDGEDPDDFGIVMFHPNGTATEINYPHQGQQLTEFVRLYGSEVRRASAHLPGLLAAFDALVAPYQPQSAAVPPSPSTAEEAPND